MMKRVNAAVIESLLAVLPISIIALILSFTPIAELDTTDRITLIIAAFLLIVGISLFTLGANMAIKPMGSHIASSLLQKNKFILLIIVSFVMGFLVTIAESDLSVLINQVHAIINNTLVLVLIGVGVGLFLVFSVLKILLKINLMKILLFSYLALFGITILLFSEGNGAFLPLAYDSGYVTSGSITVPFMMAFGLGLAKTIGGSGQKENSFGFIALCTIGPIMMVLFSELHVSPEVLYDANNLNLTISKSYSVDSDIFIAFMEGFLESAKEVGIALGLITFVFLILNFIFIKLPIQKLYQIFIGFIYTFIGHVLFLTGAKVGYLPIGFEMGLLLAANEPILLIVVGLVLGVVTVLAEPNVHILVHEVEEVTTGRISKRDLMIALCIGVGISTALSLIRTIYQFSILFYLIPLILLSFAISFFVPKIYSAIAFDSGAVASGPLTVSFILPLAIGSAVWLNAPVLEYGFGLIAMVSIVPVITIQTLGFKAVIAKKIATKRKLKRIIIADDEQIINFI